MRCGGVPNLFTIPHQLNREARTCRAIVETPAGSRSKFDYDVESGLFELHKVLPAGMAFPLAFGFVPGTLAGDGDPLDILILAEEALPIGCILTAQLLGVIEAEQTQDGKTCRNDRLIARTAQSRAYADLKDLDRLGEAFISELTNFFVTYQSLSEHRFQVLSIGDAARACRLVTASAL